MYEQIEKPKESKSRAVANSVAQKKSNVKQGFGFVDNRPEAIIQKKLCAGNRTDQILQFDKGKEARESEVASILKTGNSKIGSLIGQIRPYLENGEQNFIFLAGLIKGGFDFSSLGSFLKVINEPEVNRENIELQVDITNGFSKVIGFKDDFTAVIGEKRNEFRDGRIAEFQGLAGELSAAAQLIKTGKTVSRLGAIFKYGNNESQEVDLVSNGGDKSYFVEVAATPSKLKDKIDGGIKKTYPQMEGYKNLAKERDGFQVAYSCPTLSVGQISSELIEKIKLANVYLIVKGDFYNASELQMLVEEYKNTAKKTKKKTTKSHKQTDRNDRRARLDDRGSKPGSKDLLRDALNDYYEEQTYDQYEEYSDSESEYEEDDSFDELSPEEELAELRY